ncbi:uncharacterized protein LOC106392572 [Brassica napus]|uniref:uncharacterized protein LOC106392572 n=1 Tax=Brassica napus TaxID=3708 RepID=UPI0006AB2019|nr:uncharacterized protein LOC106392572 [Brassica napus]
MAHSFPEWNFDSNHSTEAENGRIVVIWNPALSVITYLKAPQLVVCGVFDPITSCSFTVAFVYAFNDRMNRLPLWADIKRLASSPVLRNASELSRHLEYEKMEQHKKKYLENFALMYGNQTVEEFIRIIVRDEKIVRACYAESTDWISSEDFVEMMLVDSVFILVFLKQTGRRYIDKTGDFLFDKSCHRDTIFEDLLLLENQLPFSLLENLFGPFFIKFGDNLTFHELDSAGVDIVGNKVERGTSFERGVLTMPCFTARGHTERLWRNIMALEQCHYTYAAYVCHYITFLDFLIDTEQDVELLVNKGVIKNLLGHSESVVEMVNKMCLGLADNGSYYYDIAERLNKYYDNRLNRSLATLRRVYFKDLWTGTATIAAVIILVLTLIGTVTSVLQVTQDDSDPTKSLLPPPPSRDL